MWRGLQCGGRPHLIIWYYNLNVGYGWKWLVIMLDAHLNSHTKHGTQLRHGRRVWYCDRRVGACCINRYTFNITIAIDDAAGESWYNDETNTKRNVFCLGKMKSFSWVYTEENSLISWTSKLCGCFISRCWGCEDAQGSEWWGKSTCSPFCLQKQNDVFLRNIAFKMTCGGGGCFKSSRGSICTW